MVQTKTKRNWKLRTPYRPAEEKSESQEVLLWVEWGRKWIEIAKPFFPSLFVGTTNILFQVEPRRIDFDAVDAGDFTDVALMHEKHENNQQHATR